jgi:putative oxidoreductase
MTAHVSDRVTSTGGRLASLWAAVEPPLRSLAALLLRIALAVPFFRSGLTKWDGFLALSPSTAFLFEHEFKLHLFGGEFAMPFPVSMAWASAIGEIVLPVLLVVGLATRFAAAGILAMAAIIHLTYPAQWASEGLPWAAMALAIIAFGPGRVAIDRLIANAMAR